MNQNEYPIIRYNPVSDASLHTYVQHLFERKWIVLLAFLATLGATFGALQIRQPVYQTHVLMMYIAPSADPSAGFLESSPQRGIGSTSIKGHIEIMRSASAIKEIQNRLKSLFFNVGLGFQTDLDNRNFSDSLRQEFEKNRAILSQNLIVSIEERQGTWLITDKDNQLKYIVKKEGDELNVFYEPKKYNFEFMKSQIKRGISLESPPDSSLIRLTTTAETPERALALANITAEVYKQKLYEIRRADLIQGITFLEQQMASVNRKLIAVEKTLNELKTNRETASSSQDEISSPLTSSRLLGELQKLEENLSEIQIEIEWTAAKFKSVQNMISKVEQTSVTYPPLIVAIQAELVKKRLELGEMRSNFTEEDPEVISLTREIDQLQGKLDLHAANNQNLGHYVTSVAELQDLKQETLTLILNLETLKKKEVRLQEKITNFQAEHPDLTTEQIELTSLERQARVHERSYMVLLEKFEEMSLSKEMEMSRLQIIVEAELPTGPTGLSSKILFPLGGIFGLGLGVAIAFLFAYLDHSIKQKEDVEKYLGLPMMGIIPRMKPFKLPKRLVSEAERQHQKEDTQLFSRILLYSQSTQVILSLELELQRDLSNGNSISDELRRRFSNKKIKLPPSATLKIKEEDNKWLITDKDNRRIYDVRKEEDQLNVYERSYGYGGSYYGYGAYYGDKGSYGKSKMTTSYQTLAAQIRYANVDKPIKVLLITSATPNEGKTTTATNLAISLAQSGKKVLLIDADLRRRQIHRIFQQKGSPGLTEFLIDENTSPEDFPLEEPFIRSTEVDNLYIFPAGIDDTNTPEDMINIPSSERILGSNKMERLIKNLKAAYDIILLDSAPLLAVADAMILATHVDGTLLVLRSNVIKRQLVLEAMALLENINVEILGVILNGNSNSRQYRSYYY